MPYWAFWPHPGADLSGRYPRAHAICDQQERAYRQKAVAREEGYDQGDADEEVWRIVGQLDDGQHHLDPLRVRAPGVQPAYVPRKQLNRDHPTIVGMTVQQATQ